jgi:nickel-dependent lactate racemase
VKNYKLKYGDSKIDIKLPDNSVDLRVSEPGEDISREYFERSLNKLLNIEPDHSIGIIVSDKTRLCSYDVYLPWLTENLELRGVKPGSITFYIAYGTHPRQTDEESLKAYGKTFLEYNFIHHDCNDKESMLLIGKTSRGTDVTIRKDIFKHDSLILFGAISHHYFAGYGGGRKLIFPGLAGREAIYQNHKLFIDFSAGRLNPGCQSGKLTGNPVAEDLKEIDDMLPDKLIISGILNKKGAVAVIKFNMNYNEFTDTCSIYDRSYRCRTEEKFDTVIASAGGYPKDINFIQTHKSLHNAASFVKDNGTLILLGECRDGVGNLSFMDIFSGSEQEIVNKLKTNYSGNGGTALATLTKTSRINVLMFTDLNAADCTKMQIKKLDKNELITEIQKLSGNIAVIENASIIF